MSDCILHPNKPMSDGYVLAWVSETKKYVKAHRTALEKKLGRPILPGYYALHTCRNRNCVNPEHLYEGTARNNTRDSIKDGTHRTWGSNKAGKKYPKGKRLKET